MIDNTNQTHSLNSESITTSRKVGLLDGHRDIVDSTEENWMLSSPGFNNRLMPLLILPLLQP